MESRYNVIINIDIAEGKGHVRHIEEDVTFGMAMNEAKRQVEYLGSDNVKSVNIDFEIR